MKRQIQMLLFVVFAMMLLAGAVSAARDKQHRHGLSMSDNDEAPGDDCATHFRISSDDRNVARGEEEHTIAAGSFQTLRLEPGRNGGVLLRGWDQPNVRVKICKAGVGNTQAEAEAALKAIQVSVNGGDVRSSGPGDNRDDSDMHDHNSWVHFIVQVPANISTDMTTWNGPLSVRNVKGSVSAHSQNGPISIAHSSGTLTAEAHNGPIEVKDSG